MIFKNDMRQLSKFHRIKIWHKIYRQVECGKSYVLVERKRRKSKHYWRRFAVNLVMVHAKAPHLFAKEIVGIQPMTAPTSVVFKLTNT